jgi:hypothetical protein
MNLHLGSHLKWALHFVGTIVSDKHKNYEKEQRHFLMIISIFWGLMLYMMVEI